MRNKYPGICYRCGKMVAAGEGHGGFMSNKILAWYFSEESRKLRHGDGREIAIGVEHTVKGYPEPCEHGLHASESILDALLFAPGPILWRVELSGRIKRDDNKITATRRRYIGGGVDISDTLRRFACEQALSVAHLWDMPAIVREYLETMDESKRVAARDASRVATRSAARVAAMDADWDARVARVAARSAARSADWKAAWAAWAAARSAARDASRDTWAPRDAAEKHLLDLLKDRHGIE